MCPTLNELAKDLEGLGPRFAIADDCPDTLQEWARAGICLPSGLVKRLLSDICEECRITVCCHKGGNGRFELRFSEADKRIATATRTFSLSQGLVNHEGFSVIAERQGRGLATLLTRNSVEVYRAVGISRVTLTAGLEGGGYVWARFGFLPTRDSWKQVRGAVQAKLASVGKIPPEAEEALGYALADDDPAAIWEIADLDATIGGRALGRLLLSGAAWDGMLEFNNMDATDRLSAYVTVKTGRRQ